MGIPSNPLKPGTTVQGKISWFGGPNDPSAGTQTASGLSTGVPGIALYNQATLKGYWLVTAPNGKQQVVQQTDLGPAPWTGRAIDFTSSSLGKFGYNEGNFPTDAVAKATYLGQSIPANYQHLAQGGGAASPQAPPGSPPSYQVKTTNVFDQAGYQQAKNAYTAGSFISQLDKSNPYNIPVKGEYKAPDPLLASGVLTTTPPDPQSFVTAQNTLQKIAGGAPLSVHPGAATSGKGYVNPIQGFRLSDTDEGVDASAAPGTPIRAIGDSRLTQVLPNWYSGQPLLLFQFMNGPKAGQYWYVAEQISPTTTQIGHVFHAGDPVATFASSGTGIEIGYGSPTSNQRTLAGQQGINVSGRNGSAPPAGVAFRQFLGQLGAH